MTLSGHVALVTGARRGIGRAIANRLAAAGVAVIIGALADDDEGLHETVASLRQAGARAEPLAFDLGNAEARADAIARASEPFGPVDILVNNAAMNNYAAPSEMDLAYRRLMFDVNVHSAVDLIQQALPGMKAKGWGRILNITSASLNAPQAPFQDSQRAIAMYGASKLALERFTTGLAVELHGTGITANSYYPTAVCVTGSNSAAALTALRSQPELAESVDMMAEAAMLLIDSHMTGIALPSRDILFMLQAPLHARDGKTVIGDANTLAELGA